MVGKKLARLTLTTSGEVDGRIASFALNRLSRSELKNYLFHLREEIARRRVEVSVAGPADETLWKELEKEFSDKETIVSSDETLGAGVRVRDGDDVIDASVKGLVEETIDRLKKE
jgi:F0F1-type ATP synthase delta subunit